MIQTCEITIDGIPYSIPVEGEFFWGKDEMLFHAEDNLISKKSWMQQGYDVMQAFSQSEFKLMKESVTNKIFSILKSKNLASDESSFSLQKYHEVVKDHEKHNEVIFVTRELRNEDFTFDIDSFAKKISDVLGYKLATVSPELGRTHVQVRMNRPLSLDINPPHRDGYISYYKDAINIWIPIAGCNAKSSLPVMPGSHFINEKDIYRTEEGGAKINGNIYRVPCILKTKQGLNMVRPNPKETEALIFTPFLIHGAAVNSNEDNTRVALELRFLKS